MATLTSNGNVNLTSSTNWSPTQVPTIGDDLVLVAGHTLTADADLTLNSITVNGSTTSRFVFSGTRTITVTDKITYLGSAGTSATNPFFQVSANCTLNALHYRSGGNIQYLFYVNGENVTLTGNGSGVLVDTNGGYMTLVRMDSGTLSTSGRFLVSSAGNGFPAISLQGSGTWTHSHTGVSTVAQADANSPLFQVQSGSAKTITFTGDCTWNGPSSNQNAASTIWHINGPATVTYTGTLIGNGTPAVNTILGSKCISILNASATFNMNGSIYTEYDYAAAVYISAGTLNWDSQSVSVPANKTCLISQLGGNVNFQDLDVSNSGKFAWLRVGGTYTNTVTGFVVTNVTSTAQAFVSDNGIVINLESDPPTLPAVEDVASGTVYGYTGIELTGTGLILDPAVLATAVDSALTNNDEVLETLANAKIAAMKLGG